MVGEAGEEVLSVQNWDEINDGWKESWAGRQGGLPVGPDVVVLCVFFEHLTYEVDFAGRVVEAVDDELSVVPVVVTVMLARRVAEVEGE